jgi:hypothetical protein
MPQNSKPYSEKRSVSPSDVIEVMAKNGVEISEENAEKLLDFMYFFGKLTVNQYVKNNSKIDEDQ